MRYPLCASDCFWCSIDDDDLLVVPDMKLSPNVGSDRSWVWNAAADVSEGEPEAQTLAIRFANSESKLNSHYMQGTKSDLG